MRVESSAETSAQRFGRREFLFRGAGMCFGGVLMVIGMGGIVKEAMGDVLPAITMESGMNITLRSTEKPTTHSSSPPQRYEYPKPNIGRLMASIAAVGTGGVIIITSAE